MVGISLFAPINRYQGDAWRFDEHDLVAQCEVAGLVDIHLALHVFVRPATPQP